MKQMLSPIAYFGKMKDYRDERYISHKLINIVAISIAAIICGAEDWYEVEDYGSESSYHLITVKIYASALIFFQNGCYYRICPEGTNEKW